MPAYLHSSQDLGLKIVSVYPHNSQLGLPIVTGMVLVLDSQTGLPQALMDGNSLTAIRTGAAGGLAASLLSRSNSTTVALFGAGVQAKTQLQAVMTVRNIQQVNLFSRTQEKTQQFAQEISTWENAPRVNLVATPQDGIVNADIIITATTSTTPVFEGKYLQKGTHITAIGSYTPKMREIDEITLQKARIFVDSREACLAEAGDIIIANAHIDAELGEIINGQAKSRQSNEEITLFKSVGIPDQDVVAAKTVLEQAQLFNYGTIVFL
jgi:ornithine cyclodeaminase